MARTWALRYWSNGTSVTVIDTSDVDDAIKKDFDLLAEQWHRETRFFPSATKMAMHPAYQGIIALGQDVIPLVLHDLQRTRAHWLWALHVLSRFQDPAPEGATFSEAVDAWLEWGENRGLM
jgi:hypothetical protein